LVRHIAHEFRQCVRSNGVNVHPRPLGVRLQVTDAGRIAGLRDPELEYSFRNSIERRADRMQTIDQVAL
jgi:hypothetical protein